jgi:hypothetical protein
MNPFSLINASFEVIIIKRGKISEIPIKIVIKTILLELKIFFENSIEIEAIIIPARIARFKTFPK